MVLVEPGAAVSPAGAWDVAGPPGAPALVFVHGAVLSRSMWGPQVERLRDRYRCVTVDLPGHGVLATEPFELGRAVDVVTGAIDDAAGGRAVVVGLSLGGYVAIATAAAHPERVRGLVISGASMEPRGLAHLAYLWYGWSLRILPQRLVRDAALELFRRAYGREVGAALARGYDARAGGRGVIRIAGQRFRDRLRAYGGPALVLNGTLDRWFCLGERSFVAGIPAVTVIRLPGATHLASLDRPGEFATAIADFEASLPA